MSVKFPSEPKLRELLDGPLPQEAEREKQFEKELTEKIAKELREHEVSEQVRQKLLKRRDTTETSTGTTEERI